MNGPTRHAIVIPLEDCETALSLDILLAQRISTAMRRMGQAVAVWREEESSSDLVRAFEWGLRDIAFDVPLTEPRSCEAVRLRLSFWLERVKRASGGGTPNHCSRVRETLHSETHPASVCHRR